MAEAGTQPLEAALPDYEVLQELGRGAMGIVYLGRHKALGRTVAIKELPPSFAVDATVRERFLTEARVVASLDHPHVVVIHDFVDRDGHLALVMEHLPNGTVWDQFLQHGLAAPRACGLVLATLAGVHHAHDRGVMHRDIKPENLIFTHDWQLKVTDFGIAQVLSGEETMGTMEGAIIGTPAYMSPEQAEGRSCGPQADVYASGTMLYEMLTGSLPFPHAASAMEMARARLSDDPVPITSVGPAIPGAIAEVTMQALQRSESARFASAEAFGVALAEAAALTWGPEWMFESGTEVRGSEAIELASRTTAGSSPQRQTNDERATIAEADDRPTVIEPDGQSTVLEPEERPTVIESNQADALAPTPAAPALPMPPEAVAKASAVVPLQREHLSGANLFEIAPSDMLNLAEVRSPRSPLLPAILALVGFGVAIAMALIGLGVDPAPTGDLGVSVNGIAASASSEPIEVDLTEPFTMSGVDADAVDATFLGIPVGSAFLVDGEVDPGYLRFSGAGVLELSPSGDNAPVGSVPIRSTNNVYPTAPFVVAAMVLLGGLASVQSNLRGLRARKFRISPFIGLAISGALSGAALAILAMLVLSTPAALDSVVAAAAAGAFGSVALGEGFRRWRRRRRLRRVTVASGRRPGR